MSLQEKLAEAKRLRDAATKMYNEMKFENDNFFMAPSKTGFLYLKDKRPNPQPGMIHGITKQDAEFIVDVLKEFFEI